MTRGIIIGLIAGCIIGTSIPYIFQFPYEWAFLWGVASGGFGVIGGLIFSSDQKVLD